MIIFHGEVCNIYRTLTYYNVRTTAYIYLITIVVPFANKMTFTTHYAL